MRHLLLSAAALTLMTGTAFAQPDHERHVGKASVAPQVQDRAQAELRAQAAPQRDAQGGGPTSFTNQVQGQQPDQGQRRDDRRDGRGPGQAQQPAPPPQVAAPQQGRDRGGNWQGQGGRDNRAGYDNRQNDRYDNRSDNNRYNNGYRGDNNRYNNGYRGQRRDFSRYGNYHRDWRPTQRYRAPAYRRPNGWYARRWSFGEFLPSLFWARDYWLDYRIYDLPPPPYGAVWVRVGDDALMIDEDSGEIITVAYNVFY